MNTSALSLVFRSSVVLFNLLQPDELDLYTTFSPNLCMLGIDFLHFLKFISFSRIHNHLKTK